MVQGVETEDKAASSVQLALHALARQACVSGPIRDEGRKGKIGSALKDRQRDFFGEDARRGIGQTRLEAFAGEREGGPRRRHGGSHVPEDRQKQGLILNFRLDENVVVKNFYREPYSSKLGILNFAPITEEGQKLIEQFDIRAGQGPATKAKNMSGGNQQKVIIAREIELSPHLLVVAQPTRGLDVGAIEYIHKRIIEERDKGRAILLVSFELDEIMESDLHKLTDVFVEDITVKHRLVGVGVLSQKEAYELGAVGPMLRASGIAYDVRKRGYAAYGELDFDVVTESAGDCYARCLVRIRELFQSIRLIKEAAAKIPAGELSAKVLGMFAVGLANGVLNVNISTLMGAIDDYTIYYTWKKGLITFYPREIHLSYASSN